MYNGYVARNNIINNLGFLSYKEYLNSSLWKSIRNKILPSKCILCPKRANQIHHYDYTYENLTGESLKHLYPVCGNCHKKIEFTIKGEWLSFKRSQSKFKRLLKKSHKYYG